MDDTINVTQLLHRWRAGDPQALERAIPLIYGQLRAVAHSQLRRERGGHTLQATALVNEFYLRLSRQHAAEWKDREHFYAFASMVMRRILIDYAKHVLRGKRGGGLQRLPLSDDLPWLCTSRDEILALDEALSALQKIAAVLPERVGGCGCESGAPGTARAAWRPVGGRWPDEQQKHGKEVVLRADAAFAKPEIYEALEERGVNYAIRIPANENLERDIAELLPRPVGRPSMRPLVGYKSFLYQAASWKKARRVVAKVEHHQGELFPRVGFIVTN